MLSGTLEDWQLRADIASSVVTALAVLVGGGWAYWRFFRERTRWPRAEVELLFDERRLDEQTLLLNVKVRVKNAGRGLMQLTRLRVDLRQVLPLSAKTRGKIQAEEQFDNSGVKAHWPLIKKHERTWGAGKGELEPGETDDFEFDFFVEPPTQSVLVYAFLENVAKKRGNRKLGWGERRLHDLSSET